MRGRGSGYRLDQRSLKGSQSLEENPQALPARKAAGSRLGLPTAVDTISIALEVWTLQGAQTTQNVCVF